MCSCRMRPWPRDWPPFGFFEFALAGIPLLLGTMVIIVLFGQRLLPNRNGATMPADLSKHAQALVEQYGLAREVYRLRVRLRHRWLGAPAMSLSTSGHIQVCSLLRYKMERRVRRSGATRSWKATILC